MITTTAPTPSPSTTIHPITLWYYRRPADPFVAFVPFCTHLPVAALIQETPSDDDPLLIAEIAWLRAQQITDDINPDNDLISTISHATRRWTTPHTSMMPGDVVQIGTHFYVCQAAGWAKVAP